MGVLDIITGILGFGFKLYNQLSEQDQQKIKDNFAKQQAETKGEIAGFDAELAKLAANHDALLKERAEKGKGEIAGFDAELVKLVTDREKLTVVLTAVDEALADNKRLAAIVEKARAAGFNVDEP